MPNLKDIVTSKWQLIKKQRLLREMFKDPPIISYKKGKSLGDILVRAELYAIWGLGQGVCSLDVGHYSHLVGN